MPDPTLTPDYPADVATSPPYAGATTEFGPEPTFVNNENKADGSPLPEDAPPAAQNTEWLELRHLLLRPEQVELSELKARFGAAEQHAQEVSQVLPQAILLRTARDKRLAKALQPTFEEALRVSIKKDPKPFLDAVTPVIGAAIRRALAEALSAMMESLTRTLDNSISVRSIKWRIESVRTGRPFAEVVLLNTLEYRVEQVFLIHRETGLLLQHAEAAGQGVIQDADMVSGMLTAIQDFVRDSFSMANTEMLKEMKVGDMTVWVEQGPQALLACAVRGQAPAELRLVLQDALDSIHLDFHDQLNNFEGDAASLDACQPYLQACLQVSYHKSAASQANTSVPTWKIGAGILAAVLLVWGFLYGLGYWRWSAYIDRLRAEPGLVVVEQSYGFFGSRVEGLRDPLAADPDALLSAAHLETSAVARYWGEYQALNPTFVEQRARRLLEPPEGVRLTVKGGVLSAQGTASAAWIEEARKLSRGLAGVKEFVYSNAEVADKALVEQSMIMFPVANATLTPENLAQVQEVANALKRLQNQRPGVYRVEIFGSADTTGTAQINAELRRQRALNVKNALITAGCTAEQFTLHDAPEEESAPNRSVSFKISGP